MIEHCAVCGSRQLVRSVRVETEILRLRAGVYAPGGPLGLGQSIGDVRGIACVDCGNVQWFATNKRRLAELYEEQQAQSVRLNEVPARS